MALLDPCRSEALSITLLSASPERRAILEESGWRVALPDRFLNAEEDEKPIARADAGDVSLEVLDAKLKAYSDARLMDAPGKYLIADTIVHCAPFGAGELVLGKCRDALMARAFLDIYSKCSKVTVRSSAYLLERLDGSDGRIGELRKRLCADEAIILLEDEDGANLVTCGFRRAYLASGAFIGRAGALDVGTLERFGFRIAGNRQTIRGLCPF